MLRKILELLVKHLKNNLNTYFFLLLAFIIGVSAGAFTVNGLSTVQRDELESYVSGFLKLMDSQQVDGSRLLNISVYENIKIIAVLWILGVTIIGIPFIFIIIGIRGFVTGFTSGFIIETMGIKGALFTASALLPKEVIIVPCLIALGVNGINFSLNIIKKKSVKHLSKENLKTSFLAYCAFTILFSCFIFAGVLIDAYITPVFIRMVSPFM